MSSLRRPPDGSGSSPERSSSEMARRVRRRLQLSLRPGRRVALSPTEGRLPGRQEFESFGPGSWIVPPARITGARHMEIGSDVVVMEHAVLHAEPRSGSHIGSVLTLGHGVHIARFSTIWATVGIHVGAEVLTSDNVALMDCWAPPGQSHHSIVPPPGSPVVIGDGAYLGCGCIICPGVEVGEGAFIGEGAVVMDNVPPHAVVYGNPARVTSVWTEANGWQGRMFGVPA